MVRFLFLSVFLSLFALVSAQSALDQDNGILGYQLGAEGGEMKGLLRDGKFERLGRYRPVDDSLRWEGILTSKVRLYFFEGKLHSIDVKLKGAEADKMLAYLKARYGQGKQEDAMGFRYSWMGSRVYLLWDQNLVSHDATMSFRDEEVHRKYYKFMQSLN